MAKRYLTSVEAAQRLGIKLTSLYPLLRGKHIRGRHRYGVWTIPAAEVERYAAMRRRPAEKDQKEHVSGE